MTTELWQVFNDPPLGWVGGLEGTQDTGARFMVMTPEGKDWLILMMTVAIGNLPPSPDPNTDEAIALKAALENPLDQE